MAGYSKDIALFVNKPGAYIAKIQYSKPDGVWFAHIESDDPTKKFTGLHEFGPELPNDDKVRKAIEDDVEDILDTLRRCSNK